MAKITILMILIAETLKKNWSLTQVSLSGWWGEPAEPEKRGAGTQDSDDEDFYRDEDDVLKQL